MSLTPVQDNVLTLDSLLMRTGPLSGILKETKTWTGIASKLGEVFLPKAKKMTPEERSLYVVYLCTTYYAHGKKRFVYEYPMSSDAKTDQVTPAVDFLETFMTANGQWPYIKAQPWYTTGDYVIAIDVNYYPDRSGYKVSPGFHKDTGGNNIFVSLIFDNKKTIEATEWFADLAKPSAQRARWQEKLLPSEHLKELQSARDILLPKHKDKNVSGGVAVGENIYVSWVDDLVWHSTPSTARRMEVDVDIALGAYGDLDATADSGLYHLYDPQLKSYVIGMELLGSMAECTDTGVHKWLAQQGYGPQDITDMMAPVAWKALYHGPEGKTRFEKDVRLRATTPWRLTGAYTEANAKEPRLTDSEGINEPPVGLAGRRRANSVDQEELEKARLDNEGVPRSFIRTWVRVLPKNAQELTDYGVVFKS